MESQIIARRYGGVYQFADRQELVELTCPL